MLKTSTKRILACSTVSRKEHLIAQTRELQCTKQVLPQVLERAFFFIMNMIVIFVFIFHIITFIVMTRTYTKPAKAIYYSVLHINLDIGELTC